MTQRDKDLLDLVKCRIHFTTPEGEYEGYVLIVCPVSKKVMVSNILFLPKRTPMGTLNFNFRDIMTYKIISRPDPSNDLTNNIARSSAYAKDTCIIDELDSVADDLESIVDESVIDFEEEEYTFKIPSIFLKSIPVDNFVIDRIGEDFRQAVRHIFEQDCIGVGFEGPKIGRNGNINFITIATSTGTFIFDVDRLGSEAFKEGLKKIFENPNIEKVIHDCRQPSDCLFHKYNTRLVNIFDTQVADLMVTIQRSQNCKFSKRVNSIDTLLRTYLEVPENFIHKSRTFHNFEEEVVYSRLRPLQPERRDVMVKNAVYLRLLKRELTLAMLMPFRRAVEVYLNVVQTSNDRELLLVPSVPEEMPHELLLEGIQVVRFKEYVDIPPIVASGPPYRKLNNPVKSYTNYCEEFDKNGRGESLSSSGSEVSDSDKSSSPRLFSVSQGGSPFTYKDDSSTNVSSENSTMSLTVIKGVDQVTSLKSPPSVASSRIDKILSAVKNNTSTVKESNSDGESLGSTGKSPKARFLKDVSRLRAKLPTDNLSDSEKSMSTVCQTNSRRVTQSLDSPAFTNTDKSISTINKDIRKFRAATLLPNPHDSRSINRDSSDSESEFSSQRQSFKDIVIDFLETRKSQGSEPSYSPESSGSSVVEDSDKISSDENPWAALKAEFASFDCSPDSTKYRFVPA